MGKTSRTKGHSFERKVAILFREAGWEDARRGLQYRDGEEAPDVIVPGFRIECKARKESISHNRVLVDCARYANAGEIPVAVIKLDRQKPTATLYLEDLLDILKEWKELKDK